MKKKIQVLALLIILLSSLTYAQKTIDIIPQPISVKLDKNSFFTYDNNTKIICNVDSKEYSVAEYLHSQLQRFNNSVKPILPKKDNPKYNIANSIIFVLSSDKTLGKEGYQIDILQDRIVVSANDNPGFFYAAQTLIQLIMPNDATNNNSNLDSYSANIPSGRIIDYPRFTYRGKHLDCARHFFTKEEVKQYIDLMAFHKLNTLHWHLTDDQGWRVEIKKYPKLQTIASKRKETLIGHYSDTPIKYDGKEYGGYYTQEEIKEVVEYAKQRFIRIIPEIEMPGHALAALSAYPELGCRDEKYESATTWGVFEEVFCTKEETFVFLQNVLDEVVELFPSEYIHIGGDECPKKRWKECQICQNRIKGNNLKDEYELQSYFMNRIEKYLEAKGKKVIGWDEILEGGLKGEATVMSWQGEAGAIAAAKSGHDAIMVPTAFLYFDYYQGSAEVEPLGIGGFVPLKKVYDFEPVPKELNETQAKHIIGVQANTWTEYIPTFKKVQYMDIPRIAALSEIAWTKKENKDYNSFLKRLDKQIGRYDYLGYNYAISHYSIQASTKWNAKKKQVEVTLYSPMPNSDIYYTTNNEEPTISSIRFSKPIIIKENTTLKARAISKKERKDNINNAEKLSSPLFSQQYTLNKATGKEYKMQNINPAYSGNSAFTLTDGLFGTRQSYDRWVGTLGEDYVVELDLKEKTQVKNISINFLDEKGSWIFAPMEVSFFISKDKKEWEKIKTINTKDIKPNENSIFTYNSELKKEIGRTRCENVPKYVSVMFDDVRYIRIEAKSIKTCPEGHSGYGYKAHCFADEIIVE